jgi:hypothetical protein
MFELVSTALVVYERLEQGAAAQALECVREQL